MEALYYFSSHSNGIWCFLLVFIYVVYYEWFQLYGDVKIRSYHLFSPILWQALQ